MQERPRVKKLLAYEKENLLGNAKSGLGFKVAHREVIEVGGAYALREESEAYEPNFSGKNESLSS